MFEERMDSMVNWEERSMAVSDTKDWIKEGKTLKPMEQGTCASCWAMATVGAVESRYAIATGTLKRFSVQELVDCTYEYTGIDKG